MAAQANDVVIRCSKSSHTAQYAPVSVRRMPCPSLCSPMPETTVRYRPAFRRDRRDINPASFYVGLIAVQESAAAGRQDCASPRHTRKSTHLRQRGAGDNQIDQDDLFDCRINNGMDSVL
ncbi:hypothetical protein [Halomonas elongata]|uniref:hypothetical protein n=1 Tax=Halomonas elongata TaxID=2746 RepID=UPI0023B08B53|nr:hypothetical protein [Halomonas elongata]